MDVTYEVGRQTVNVLALGLYARTHFLTWTRQAGSEAASFRKDILR